MAHVVTFVRVHVGFSSPCTTVENFNGWLNQLSVHHLSRQKNICENRCFQSTIHTIGRGLESLVFHIYSSVLTNGVPKEQTNGVPKEHTHVFFSVAVQFVPQPT